MSISVLSCLLIKSRAIDDRENLRKDFQHLTACTYLLSPLDYGQNRRGGRIRQISWLCSIRQKASIKKSEERLALDKKFIKVTAVMFSNVETP